MTHPAPSPSLATLAASFAVAIDPGKGIVGALVFVKAPTTKHSPSTLRQTFEDSIGRADSTALASPAADAFLATLPDVITPVAALGLAVREAVEADGSTRWVHNRQHLNASRWTYCASRVTSDSVSIHGDATCAEASADGKLTIDADVPPHIATALRSAYDRARSVVEPSRVLTFVVAHLRGVGGRQITSDVYLLPEITPTTCGILAGLVDLGGWADTVAVADPAKIARLTSPVSKSIEEQIDDVVRATAEFIARAEAITAGGDGIVKRGTGEAQRAKIAEARAAAALWRDLLGLASLDVDTKLAELDAAAEAADKAALAALDERRKAKAEAKKAETELAKHLAVIDDEQATEERREEHTTRATHAAHVAH